MAGNEQQIVLQPELGNKILLKLWQNNEDLEHILTCREVCRSWKDLVDKMHPNLFWNPWLADIEYRHHVIDLFKYHLCTSFKQDADVNKFLLEHSATDNAGKNPFRNQTVRLFQCESQQDDVKNEEENILMILRQHGHHIRQLLLVPHEALPETLRNLPQLLSGMTNLRTLILDFSSLPEEHRAIRAEDFPKDLKHLRELVFKCSYFNRRIADDTWYGKLSLIFGPQIKSISFIFLDLHIGRRNVLDCFPNLEDLKVEYLDSDNDCGIRRQPSGNLWPKLRRIALGSKLYSEGSVGFENILKIVRCFSDTLELLSLGFGYERSEDEGDDECEPQNESADNVPAATIFPKLEKLILPFSTMYITQRRQPTAIPIERRLNFGFPALKSVFLMDIDNEFGEYGELLFTDFKAICETLWPVVPSSVETISIRNSWRWNSELQREFPDVYKCSRNPIS